MTVEEFQRLKKEEDSLIRREASIDGSLEEILSRLRDFGVETLEEAESLLAREKRKLRKQEEELEETLENLSWKQKIC